MIVTKYRSSRNGYRRNSAYDLFNELLNSGEQDSREMFDFSPSVNTREGKEAYHIDVDLPGMNKNDVEISVDQNLLTISGKREIKNEINKDDYYKIESSYGSFSRSFTLPEKVDVENIRAVSEDGVFEIIIPKLTVFKDSVKKIKIQ
jgi:HSP20 family protein